MTDLASASPDVTAESAPMTTDPTLTEVLQVLSKALANCVCGYPEDGAEAVDCPACIEGNALLSRFDIEIAPPAQLLPTSPPAPGSAEARIAENARRLRSEHGVNAEPWYLAGWSRFISPSSLGRAAACIRSEAMPHANSSGDYAMKGTIAHKFLADVLDYGVAEALTRVEHQEDVEWLQNIQLEKLPAFDPQGYAAEVAIAYDPRTRTAREVGRGISREEARRLSFDHEIVGIIDVLGAAAEHVVVHDYKTGWGFVEGISTNWQLKAYALFAARLLGKAGALYSVVRTKDNDSAPWSDVAFMDEFDLLMFEDELIALLKERERVREATRAGRWHELPAFNEGTGKHCRYCPAKWTCPVKTQAPFRLAKVLAGTQEMTDEIAAAALVEYEQRKAELERIKAVLDDYAWERTIPLSDGEVYGVKLQPTETIVPARLRSALERQWGPLGAAVAGETIEVEESATKARFEKALKRLVLPTLPPEEQKITWLKRDAYKVLRESGAVSTSVTKCVRRFTPPRVLVEEKPVEPETGEQEVA